MQRIRNIENVVSALKPLLEQYLKDQGTAFEGGKFTCPNSHFHNNNDKTPSAGFVPGHNNQLFHCFACGESGDIYKAMKFKEQREINGSEWFVVVKELADRYGIPTEMEPLKPQEVEFNHVQEFLKTLVTNANSYLNKNHPVKAWGYLKERSWLGVVDYFQLGFLPDVSSVKKYVRESFAKYPELSSYLSVDGTPDDFTSFITERLIYPIRHRYGYILGTVTRSLTDDDPRPKYVKHFVKTTDRKSVVFNLTKAYKSVYVVEGASSVFTMHQSDIKNVVSVLGADSFNEGTYNALVAHGVERIVLCLDADKAGRVATDRILELTQGKSDIKVLVKVIPQEGEDPDDVIRRGGVEAFNQIPEISSFRFQLERYKTATEEDQGKPKKAILETILSTTEPTSREKMMKVLTQETGILKTTWVDEVERYAKTKSITADIGVAEILKEETALLRDIEAFEEAALRCGRLKGIPSGFSILDSALDGVQTGLYLIVGKWNMGKSAYQSSIAINMLKEPSNYILHFALDDPKRATTIPRYLANMSRIEINDVANPIWRIDKNETLEEALKEDLRRRRNQAIQDFKGYSSRFGLKDSTDGYDTNFVEKAIKTYRAIAGDRRLIIFVDFLNMVKPSNFKSHDQTQIETEQADFFKRMTSIYDVPIFATVEGTKAIESSSSDEKSIKGSASLPYRANVIMMISSDFGMPKSWMYFYDQDERIDEDRANPIVKVWISKNKISGFKKSIFYKFYRKQSRYEECTLEENKLYSKKIIL